MFLACLAPSANASNLVIILADDLGWNDVGYHGSEIATPNIDRLAAEGVRLERFYVHPVCSPTRSALLTGRSPLNTGVMIPIEPWYSEGLPLDETLITAYLGNSGFHNAIIGKWHVGINDIRYHPVRRGFDYFYGSFNGFLNYDLHTVWGAVDWQRNGETVYEEGYATHLLSADAVRQIENRDEDAPLFLYLAYHAPHSPLQAPGAAIAEHGHIEDPMRRTYAAMVAEMDRGIGDVLGALGTEGIADDTLVIFLSDNGGSERLGADNGPYRGTKNSSWEGGIRVPAIMRWPGRIEAGTSYDEILVVEDVMPTVLTALEVDAEFPKPLDGVDQWQAITRAEPSGARTRILSSHWMGQDRLAIFEDQWKLVRMPRAGPDPGATTELFDIVADESETNDLASEYPGVVERLLVAFEALDRAPVAGIDEPVPPLLLEPGGPASAIPDEKPPHLPPYTETMGEL